MSTSKRLSVSLIFPEYWLRTHPLRTITFQAFGIGSLSLLCAGVIQSSVQASSFNIDEIYVFGDSNVDIGRVYQATGGAFPHMPREHTKVQYIHQWPQILTLFYQFSKIRRYT